MWMPARIGNYKVVESLGRGGMGEIYRAVQESLDRTVALKVLSPHMGRSEESARRFEIEAKAISLLQHNNIVSIYEYGEDAGCKFFAMQFVDGEDLGKKIAGKGSLSLVQIIDYSKQISRGLRYAHGHNVIHRDIKPQNILVDGSGVCRLTDFGIARMFEQTNITITGMAVGTPEYMSPEQAEGSVLDVRTDIYSLGVVIYEMLTKHPPFSGSNPVAVAYKQVHELPVPPSAYRKDTPKRLELIVLKALKKNKKDRYRTVEGMLNDLDTVDIDEKTDRPTLSLAARKREIKPQGVSADADDRRITDRRNRPLTGTIWEPRSVFTAGFWVTLWQTQGLSLLLIVILVLVFVYHLVGHP